MLGQSGFGVCGQGTVERRQANYAKVILVFGGGDVVAHGGVDKQLFFELARKRCLRGFTGLNFAAGELPLAGEGFAFTAPGGEDGAVAEDDGAGDVDKLWHAFHRRAVTFVVVLHPVLVI